MSQQETIVSLMTECSAMIETATERGDTAEANKLHRGSRELREQGYGSDQTYMQWKEVLGER